MRPLYEDFDDFDFDFADQAVVKQMLREQIREERRLASRRRSGPGSKNRPDDDDEEDFDDYEKYEEYNDYDDYDAEEFDRYSSEYSYD